MSYDAPLIEDAVDQFARAAAEFCSLVENHYNHTLAGFVQASLSSLSRLYAAQLRLPDLGGQLCGESDKRISYEDWNNLVRALKSKFGGRDEYYAVRNPFQRQDPGTLSLAVDHADIYRDVGEGLVFFREGGRDMARQAASRWKSSFDYHWGDHLADALRAMHKLRADILNEG